MNQATIEATGAATSGLQAAELLGELRRIFPPERLFSDKATLAAFESDGLTAFQVVPKAVVVPESEAEIVATVKLCQQMDIPFVARGSGTSLSGGSLPHSEGIVIALNKMNRIL